MNKWAIIIVHFLKLFPRIILNKLLYNMRSTWMYWKTC